MRPRGNDSSARTEPSYSTESGASTPARHSGWVTVTSRHARARRGRWSARRRSSAARMTAGSARRRGDRRGAANRASTPALLRPPPSPPRARHRDHQRRDLGGKRFVDRDAFVAHLRTAGVAGAHARPPSCATTAPLRARVNGSSVAAKLLISMWFPHPLAGGVPPPYAAG